MFGSNNIGESRCMKTLEKNVWQMNRLAKRLLLLLWMVLVSQITDDLPNFPAIRYYISTKVT